PVKQIPMELNMNLEVTPDAEIQIIFDSKAGDVMKGTGSSENLNINLNKKGDFTIFGDYIIEKGDYTFTLVNFLNKTFNVESGGKIIFIGNIKDADIELRANYSKLKTSLAPILGDGTEDKYKERISVEPQLNLSGKLFNPIVGFDIYLPDADEETRSALRNAISTQEELSRQVFSLLIMGGFISTGQALISTSATGTSAMYATTFEMVSNQLSNWLSQISKDFDIGFVYRPGYNAINPQEVQLALSTQLLNDKVVLNGNFDVRGPGSNTTTSSSNTNQLIGDFDAEIKLTEKLRLKVFNRYNDLSPGGFSPYTQGVGIFYKQDFNKFSDLFRKKVKSAIKKEDETKIKNK
ncbi:MAG TPA: translocation/assembly module TamB domain-containing protein, partial [Bacteroidales bacterium]